MPELPEVETVVRGLHQTVLGRTIKRVRINAPDSSIVVSPSFKGRKFSSILKNKTITGIDRKGKNIFVRLSGDVTLWVHLKMTGHFFFKPSSDPIEKHDLVIFNLANPNGHTSKTFDTLRFNDYRRFGRLRLFYNSELIKQKGLAELGPEPFDITADQFAELCKSRNRMIKPALLDQSFVAGIGNIYADESLHLSRIHPMRLTSSLSKKKLVELHGHIVDMLRKAIRLMGTSVDSYSGVDGRPGQYQKYLRAYNNEGNPCQNCASKNIPSKSVHSKIIRMKIGSRSAHFCPRCQRPH
jgi:formamidopyrimidine-DNA glycosylase